MFNKELPLWIIIIVSISCLISFVFFIVSRYQSSIDSSWLIALVSALLGAIVGAVLGSFITIYFEWKKTKKLEQALYSEVHHINQYLKSYLQSIINDDIQNDIDEIIKPYHIDFEVLNTITLELIKEKHIPNDDHRTLLHNLKYQIKSVLNDDKDRIVEITPSEYVVNTNINRRIIGRLVDVVYTVENFVNLKNLFKFSTLDKCSTTRVQYVFELLELSDQEKEMELIISTYQQYI